MSYTARASLRLSLVPLVTLVTTLSAVSLLFGCPPCGEGQPCADDDAGPSSGPLWEEAFDPGEAGSLSSVWGTGPDDVFMVGGGERGAIFHYDGVSWTEMDIPEVPLLVWAYGWAPDDVIAVGLGGAVLRYDGESWTALPSGVDVALWGVFGFTNDDVWIVGGDVFAGPPVIIHYDGTTFTPAAVTPEQNSVGARSLFKVWGTGGKLFAVGALGLLLEHESGAWVQRSAGPEADDDFVSLWGTSADHIVAVGGRANARVAVYDGSAWTTHAPEGVGGLNGVFMAEEGTAIVGGVFGTLGRYDVATKEVVLDDVDTRHDIHAIWGDGAGTTYAVGGNFAPPFRGVALRLVTP